MYAGCFVDYNSNMIVGIDEVGRGPWAGPLVFGAVVLGGAEIEGLTDSKKLSKKRREALAQEIHDKAAAVGLGWVSATEIDQIGLSDALKLACRRALEQIDVPYQQIVIDGTINFLKDTGKGPFVTTLAKADLLIPSVSAASIVAKVARDIFMAEQDEIYEGYSFGSHVGYGTAAHREVIERLGVTPLHRLSFAPLKHYAPDESLEAQHRVNPTTKTIGDTAEEAVAVQLRSEGYEIAERNWKTKFCEIDIVAHRKDTVYFVEVKHRKDSTQGGGVAAITPKKLKQMKFAARVYEKSKRLIDKDLQLVVIATSGTPPQIEARYPIDD